MAKAKDLNKLKPHDSTELVTKFTYCSIVYKIHTLVKTIHRIVLLVQLVELVSLVQAGILKSRPILAATNQTN